MSVKIRDLLVLNLFKSAKIEAGEKGLDNEIKRINFSDCPILEDVLDYKLVKKGDFFINSLYIVKDDEEKIMKLFEFYVKSESSGAIVIDEFVKKLPIRVIEYANKNNFPIIFIDSNVPYADIIKATMEMILLDQSDIISEMRIDRLLDKSIRKEEVILSAKHINGSFKKNYASLYFKMNNISFEKERFLRSDLKGINEFESLKYKNGILVIINFDKQRTFDSQVKYIIDLIERHCDKYKVGVSNIFTKIDNFHYCIRQAISSFEISKIIDDNVVHYKDLNVYKILYPLKDTYHIKDFYKEILHPIKEYDNYYKSDLIKTIEIYLENDGDFKKTATQLHQHENTIRYRILKTKKLLDLENNHLKFIEQISLALKIDKILRLDDDNIPINN